MRGPVVVGVVATSLVGLAATAPPGAAGRRLGERCVFDSMSVTSAIYSLVSLAGISAVWATLRRRAQ